jgi:hypothetical protein
MLNGTDRDQTRLRQLNEQYIEAVLKADVNWYREHLAGDFMCIDSEGMALDKKAFLHRTSLGPYVADYKVEDVRVRVYGKPLWCKPPECLLAKTERRACAATQTSTFERVMIGR